MILQAVRLQSGDRKSDTNWKDLWMLPRGGWIGVLKFLRISALKSNVSTQTGQADRPDRSYAEPAQYQSFSPLLNLAQIQLGVVPLQVIYNIFQVSAHTDTTQPSRSKRKHKVKLEKWVVRQTTRRHKVFFPEVQIHQSESYISVEELVGLESLATRSLELGLFQPLIFFTILILSTKGARSCPHKLATAHPTVGS